jgi:hypothetical protein
MCSFVDEWNICNKSFYYFKLLFEVFVVNIIYITNYMKKYISPDIEDNLLVKIISRITFDIFSVILEKYCL